jgi:hypothetical protein
MIDDQACCAHVEMRFPQFKSTGKDMFISMLESEFEGMFGAVGVFIVRKTVQDHCGKHDIDILDVPNIIDELVASVEKMIGPSQAKKLRHDLRARCGLPC